MTFRITTRALRTTQTLATRPAPRFIHSSTPRWTQVGYGDPPEEKAANHTPTPKPSTSADPQPGGQGQKAGQKSGTTDPEVKPKNVGNQGGDSTKKSAGNPDQNEIRETKKIGGQPQKEEVGGAGPIGG